MSLNNLKNRLFGNKSRSKNTELTDIFDVMREFSCLGEIMGRNFEVRDANDKLVYTIKQKPVAITQLNRMLKEFSILKNNDNEREATKWGSKRGRSRFGKR